MSWWVLRCCFSLLRFHISPESLAGGKWAIEVKPTASNASLYFPVIWQAYSINNFIILTTYVILRSPFQGLKLFQVYAWGTFRHLPGYLGIFWIQASFLVSLVQRRLDLYLVCSCAYFINTGVLRQNNNSVKMDQPQWWQIHGSAFQFIFTQKMLCWSHGL